MIFLTDSDAQAIDRLARVSDAAESNSAFFNQQLTHIVARMFTVKHKQIRFRDYFRINNEGGAGTQAIQMFIWDMVGSAKIIGAYADDLPSARAGAAERTIGVRWIGASLHYSWMELQQAALANRNLRDANARAADRAIEIKLNNIAFGVDAEGNAAGLYGLLNQPNIPDAPVVDNGSGDSEWSAKTPDEILADINGGFTAVSESTFGAHMPDKLALPIAQYNLLTNTRVSNLSETTLLAYIVKNLPWLNSSDDVLAIPELKGAGPGGSDVMMIFQDDEEIAEMYIPFEKAPPVGTLVDGLAYKTPIVASTAGLEIRYPLAYYRASGI